MTAPYFDNLLNAPITPEMLSLFSNMQPGTPQPQQNATSPAGPMGDPSGAAPGPQGAGLPPVSGASPQPTPPFVAPASDKKSLLARVHDALVSGLSGPGAPPGYDGLLSPDEIAQASPGVTQRLQGYGRVSTQDQYQHNLDHLIGLKQASLSVARQQQILRDRDAYYQQNPLPQNADEATSTDYLRKAYMAAMSRGDIEEMGKMAPVIDKLFPKDATPKSGSAYWNPETKNIQVFSNEPGTVIPAPWERLPASATGTYRQYVDPKGSIHVLPENKDPDPTWKAISTANAEFNQGQVGGRYNRTYGRQAVNDFETQLGKLGLDKKATLINSAEDVLNMALDKNTDQDTRAALTGPAVSQFVQAVDQSNNLRFQLLQYYQGHIDTSFRGTAQMMLERIRNGDLPGNKLQAMLKIVREAHKLTQQEIQAQRDNRVKIDPMQDVVLPDADSYFQSTTSAKPSGDLYSKYGLTPKAP